MSRKDKEVINQLYGQIDNLKNENTQLKLDLQHEREHSARLRELIGQRSDTTIEQRAKSPLGLSNAHEHKITIVETDQNLYTKDQVEWLVKKAIQQLDKGNQLDSLLTWFTAGWHSRDWIEEEYYDAIDNDLKPLIFTLGKITGIAATMGEVPKEQVKAINADIKASLSDIDHEIKRTIHDGIGSPYIGNLELAESIYDAGLRYYEGSDPDGVELRLLTMQLTPDFVRLLQIHQKRLTTTDRGFVQAWIDREIYKRYKEGEGRVKAIQVYQEIIVDIKSKGVNATWFEQQTLNILKAKEYSKRAKYVRERSSEYAKTLQNS